MQTRTVHICSVKNEKSTQTIGNGLEKLTRKNIHHVIYIIKHVGKKQSPLHRRKNLHNLMSTRSKMAHYGKHLKFQNE